MAAGTGRHPNGEGEAPRSVTLINSLEVPAAEVAQFIAWALARDYLSSQPGYIDIRRSTAPPTRKPASSSSDIADRRSADDFISALRSPGFKKPSAGLAPYQSQPGLYHVVGS